MFKPLFRDHRDGSCSEKRSGDVRILSHTDTDNLRFRPPFLVFEQLSPILNDLEIFPQLMYWSQSVRGERLEIQMAHPVLFRKFGISNLLMIRCCSAVTTVSSWLENGWNE